MKVIDIKSDGNVPNSNWNRDNRQLNLNRNDPDNRNSNNGAASGVKIYALLRDLIHPPSMRPISASLLCVWKILVSLTTLSSRKSLSFRVEISNRLEALMRYDDFNGFGAFLAIINSSSIDNKLASRLCPKE